MPNLTTSYENICNWLLYVTKIEQKQEKNIHAQYYVRKNSKIQSLGKNQTM